MKYINELDLGGNTIKNIILESLASDPDNPTAGRLYYNTTSNTVKYYNGSSWIDLISVSSIDSKVSALEVTVGDSNSGLVKSVSDLETKIGDIDTALAEIIGE